MTACSGQLAAGRGTRSLVLGRRAAILGASAGALAVSALQLPAQQATERVMETGRTPRRYVLPWVGAAIGAAASLVYFWSGPRSLPGTCSQAACVAVASLGGGAFVGWLVGKEKDELHELRYRGAQPLRAANAMELVLSGEPSQLTAGQGLVVASGTGGVHIVVSGERLQLQDTRAPALRGVTDAVAVESEQVLGLTASGGFYRFPLRNTGTGTAMRGPPATAVAVLGADFVVVSGSRVERIARSVADTARWPGITLDDSVRAIDVDERGNVWAVTATQMFALRADADSFSVVSRTAIPRGSTTKLDVVGNLAAIALGDSGVRFIAVDDPGAPRDITDWRETRYVHDVAIAGDRIFVAAAIDGVVVLSLNGTALKHHGLMRELGLVVAIEADDKYIYALDRSGAAAYLRRFPFDF